MGLLPYSPLDIIVSFLIIKITSYLTNRIFASVYEIPVNIESVYITAFILFFIITPPQNGDYSQFIWLATWSSVWAMASKFIITINNNHIFNPAAFAVLLTSVTINESASWWVGTKLLLPFTLFGGLLIVRKIKRSDMIYSLLFTTTTTTILISLIKGNSPAMSIYQIFANSAFLFFVFIMFTEPLTTPPTKWLRLGYGALVGFLFVPNLHIGDFYTTPEFAIVIGNIFSYIVSPREKLILKLKEKINAAKDTFDFIFSKDQDLNFMPGQYMEWTLGVDNPDSRGNRRFFTIASSPTEKDVHLGVKFYPEPSSFKIKLNSLKTNNEIIASQCAGDFILPEDKKEKLVFIAGGIGITPFRSMIKYLIDKKEKRTITILYSNKNQEDIAYKEVFDQAQKELEIKTFYNLTEGEKKPSDLDTINGRLNEDVIIKKIPDFSERTFYISGPHNMVISFKKILNNIGVKNSKIVTDYFPGFA
ncbi:MAG: RnfABCDGE type electron transport complex subunit D [bacterium]